jgi:DNA-directed RNA polymerase specialized sigma24 family protein
LPDKKQRKIRAFSLFAGIDRIKNVLFLSSLGTFFWCFSSPALAYWRGSPTAERITPNVPALTESTYRDQKASFFSKTRSLNCDHSPVELKFSMELLPMTEIDTQFEDLMLRVRQGDELAATELVRRYEPMIRRVVRLRLANLPLQSVVDSMDICQSVMASFFIRVHLGQYAFENPQQLIGLLANMAKSKLLAKARFESAQRRDRRRLDANAGERPDCIPSPCSSPSKIVEAQEVLLQVQSRLTDDERKISQLRVDGHGWQEVARRMQGTFEQGSPEALRKRLARAIDRISKELGLSELV